MTSYSEEMDILINDFNAELEKILNGKDVSELGIIDLRRLKHEYEAVHGLNLDLQERARNDSNVDTEELRNILNVGDQLYESNRLALVNIQDILSAKAALGRARLEERRTVTQDKSNNLKVIETFRETLREMRSKYESANSEAAKSVYRDNITSLEKSIEELEKLDKSYDDRLIAIENDISAIRYGGELKDLKEIQEQTSGLSEEEAAEEIQKRDEEKQEEVKENEPDLKDVPEEIPEIEEVPEVEEIEPIEETPDLTGTTDTPEEEAEREPIVEEEEEVIDVDIPDEEVVSEEAPASTPTGETTSTDSAPEEETPSEPTPEPVVDSLTSLQERGVLPSNLSAGQLLMICHQLGIPAANMDFVLNPEQIGRLKADSEIQKAQLNLNVVNKHKKRIEQYDKLIAQYDALLNDKIKEGTFSPEYIAKVQALKERLESERASYQDKIDAIHADSIDELFDFSNNPGNLVSNIRAGAIDERESGMNDKLRDQYRVLDEQRQMKAEATSKKMKSRMDKKINRTLSRIEKLKTKKSKVAASQVRIVNEHSDRYISRMTERQQRYIDRQATVTRNVEEINRLASRITKANEELLNVQNDLSASTGKRMADRLDRMALRQESRNLQRETARLMAKQGRTQKQIQHMYVAPVRTR